MQWRNDSQNYGGIAKGFHWVIALLVIGLLIAGVVMANADPSPFKFQLSFCHKSFGITVLALASLRLLWRLNNVHPRPLPDHAAWEKILAKMTHGLLYLALFLMPLSGWIMSSAKGFSVSVFGWFTLPDLVGESDAINAIAGNVHALAGYTLAALVCLHAAGAIKHHVIDRDSTLRRMLPVMVAAIMMVTTPAVANDVTEWAVQKDQSTITIEGTQMKAPFKGVFKSFDGVIHFDADQLGASNVAITIDMTSFDSKSKDRDGAVVGPDWFDSKTYPGATFVADKFSAGADAGTYIAHGILTIRDKTVPLDLPFALNIDDAGVATANGTVQINRLDYNVGAGQWENPKDVGTDVNIIVHVVATKVP